MKARISRPQAGLLVLLYHLEGDTPRGERLQALLKEASIPFKEVGQHDLCQKVGFLCGLPGFEQSSFSPVEAFPHEAMVLCGFSDRELDKLLKLLRENDLKVARKAALTAVNQGWSLGALLTEIDREHQLMQGRKSR